MTPTARTVAHLRGEGWPVVEVVERWNAHARIRQDFAGCIDVIAAGPHGTLAVQVTTGSNVAARIRKLADSPALPALREANWRIEVHGWAKRGKPQRWALRVVDIS